MSITTNTLQRVKLFICACALTSFIATAFFSSLASAAQPRFTMQKLLNRNSQSTVTLGPDGHLYVTVTNGEIWRYELDQNDGTVKSQTRLFNPLENGAAVNGFAFAPDASPTNLTFYASFISFADKTGGIYRCKVNSHSAGNPNPQKTKIMTGIGLLGNHSINNLAFGNDGKLYATIAGLSHAGTNGEKKHTAAVVCLNLAHSDFNDLPVDISKVNVQGSSASIQLYATGLRNPHGLLRHSNGDFYTTIHDPPDKDKVPHPSGKDGAAGKIEVDFTDIPDLVARLKRGNYYGHTNPSRGEWVYQGGNPTNGADPYEIDEYPAGTMPLANWDPSLMIKTDNHNCIAGLAEYTDGSLLVSYMKLKGSRKGAVEWFVLSSDGNFTERGGFLKDKDGDDIIFNGVLDIEVTPQGWVYVADFGNRSGNGGKNGALFLLKPDQTNISPEVAITAPTNLQELPANEQFTIRASASDSDGQVTNVALFVNNKLVKNDTTAPYTQKWTPSAGTYEIKAVATDDDGATKTSATVTVIVDASQEPPKITTASVTEALVSTPYTYDVNASGDPVPTFSLDTKPAGMTINATTGIISWTPSSPGKYNVAVRATNGVNPDDIQSFQITVADLRNPEYALGNVGVLQNGVEWSYYETDTRWDNLPRFESLQAASAGTASQINLNPAIRSDDFGLVFHGFIEVPQHGYYTLRTTSDDGSKLFIGNQLVVANDGRHGDRTSSGVIGLKAGKHQLTVQYFQAAGDKSLSISYDGPGISSAVVPAAALYRYRDTYGLPSRQPVEPYLGMPETEHGLIPETISGTGIFTDTETFEFIPGAMPYDVNSPLWSDGASKDRWFFVPTGENIQFSENGAWLFPAGSVLVKHFALGDSKKRVETRLNVVKADGTIYGVTYKWRADNSDADLVTTGVTETVNFDGTSQSWFFPGPADCLACHTPASQYILGPKTRQLNGSLTYPTGHTDNQLRTLSHLGYFDQTLSESAIAGYDKLEPLTNESASLEKRVRSYMDSNCAHCHQPGGVNANWDGRYTTPLAEQDIIDAIPLNHLGVSNARIVKYGYKHRSTLYLRTDTVEASRKMPPIGRNLKDQTAIDVLAAWIGVAPIATDDAYTIELGQVLSVDAPGVLVNDSDPNGDAITATKITDPGSGSLTFRQNGSFTFTPAEVGQVIFTYKANDGKADSAPATVTIHVQEAAQTHHARSSAKIRLGELDASTNWQTITLPEAYHDMVVTAAIIHTHDGPPLVVRMRERNPSQFDLKVQRLDGKTASVTNVPLFWLVMEAGSYTSMQTGLKIEARQVTSTITDRKGNWQGQSFAYQQLYQNPVVLGMVGSYQDERPSSFWYRGSRRKQAPSTSSLFVGKQVGENPNRERANETLNVIILEAGSGKLKTESGDLFFEARLGSDTISGKGNTSSYPLQLNPTHALVNISAMDGNDGGHAMMTARPASGQLPVAIDEDLFGDNERSHTTEQISYLALGSRMISSGATTQFLVAGVNLNGPALNVDGQHWIGMDEAIGLGLQLGEHQAGTTTVTPINPADAEAMLQSYLLRFNDNLNLNYPLTNDNYQLTLYGMHHDQALQSRFDVVVDDVVIATNQGFLAEDPLGLWKSYGPYDLNINEKTLNLTLGSVVQGSSYGDPQLMGFAITSGELDTSPPLVSYTPHPEVSDGHQGTAYQIIATDDRPAMLSYSIQTGKQDGDLFRMSHDGKLSFVTPPSITAPEDANGDNIYALRVDITDGYNIVTQPVQIHVKDDTSSLSWIEDFDLANDTRQDNGDTAWSTSTSIHADATFQVMDNTFKISDTKGELTWLSQVINIANDPVNLSVSLTSDGGMESGGGGADHIAIYYQINNGTQIKLGQHKGIIPGGSNVLSANGLTGNTLKIIIKSRVTSAAELYTIEQVKVTSQ